MSDTETNVTQLRPSKDRTAAERKRRSRAKQRKRRVTVTPVTLPTVTGHGVTVEPNLRTLSVNPKPNDINAEAAVGEIEKQPFHYAPDVAAYVAAIALAGTAAWFSIRGMVVLFPGAPMSVIAMTVAMESAKLVTAGWLARHWRPTAWLWRLILVALVAGVALINAAGVYAQLVAAHVGDRAASTSAIETQDAALAARIDLQAHTVADLDRRLGQIDTAIEEAAKRGRTNTALSAIEGQRRARAVLSDERNREAGTLATLKTERANVAAKGRQIETESAPIRYVAELIGTDTDSERAIRWLIALMVLCCDPLAIALTAAASARR
jgi:hypothetical protein